MTSTRFISKGKGRNRKSIPITPKKKGVSVRSVSLEPQAIQKINKKTIKTLNQGKPANFSSSINKLVLNSRLKRATDLRLIVFKDANKDKTFQLGTNTDLVEDLKFLQSKNANKAEIISVTIGTRKDIKDTLKRNGQTDERAQILVETAFGSERKARDTISKGLIIQKRFDSPEGTREVKLFLKSNKWDNLSLSQRESTLETLGLENVHSRKQLAKRDFDELTNFWKKELKKEGFKDEV